jgi:predicted MFS family arabinose efflux permease
MQRPENSLEDLPWGCSREFFFGIFQLSQVVGNLISSFVLGTGHTPSDKSVNLLMTIYIVIGGVGCILLYFLANEKSHENEHTEEKGLAESLFRVIFLLRDPRMLLLLPVFFFSGLEQGFVFGSFTGNIIAGSVGVGKVGFIMALFGAVDTLSSLIMGKMSDYWGNKPVVFFGFLAHLAFFACFFAAIQVGGVKWFDGHEYTLYIGAAVFGIGDAFANTFPNVMCSLYFTDDAEAAFSNLKFFQSLGSVLSFAVGSLDVEWKIVLCIGFWALAVVSLSVLHVFVASIDPGREDASFRVSEEDPIS